LEAAIFFEKKRGLDSKRSNKAINMKHTQILALLAAAMSIMITGCGSTIPVSGHHYPAVSVDSVQMLYQEPKRPYEVIALVGTVGGVRPLVADIGGLRKEAAKVGADAVIVTEAKNTSMFGRPSASGKAIKWTKP
jgi:hypothetical protein